MGEREDAGTSVTDTEVLARYTQLLLDAIAAADQTVWALLLDEDATITDESGARLSKPDLLGTFRPHPRQVQATIRAENLRVRLHGGTAVVTYVSDEHETFFGQPLHCRYRSTDTWIRRPAGWRLLASQVLALRTDPPTGAIDASEQRSLVGTFTLVPGRTLTIGLTRDGLTLTENGEPGRPLLPEAAGVYYVPGRPRYRYLPERDPAGRVVAILERREAWDLRWARQR